MSGSIKAESFAVGAQSVAAPPDFSINMSPDLSAEALAAAGLLLGESLSIEFAPDGATTPRIASQQAHMLAAALADMERRPELYRRLAS